MKRDDERVAWIQAALEKAKIDLMICARPMNVLMTTGYWPVMGCSVSLTKRDGRSILIAPEDEAELAKQSWVDEVRTFSLGSLTEIKNLCESLHGPLSQAVEDLDICSGKIVSYENEAVFEPAPYPSVNAFGSVLHDLLKKVAHFSAVIPADDLLTELRRKLTPGEIDHVRSACVIAANAFAVGRERVRIGLMETEVASGFREPLHSLGTGYDDIERADAFTFCMSGPNGFEAASAFQRSRSRRLQRGDLVLIHCNSYVDGFWTDLTRTFYLGEPTENVQRMYEAVFAARDAALKTVRPGVKACEVDAAARQTLTERGFVKEFAHGLGHGVGFAAVDHNAKPRLHPASDDVVEEGMVFNIEPAIYIEGFGGLRHCDLVAVKASGSELLTSFQSSLRELAVR